MTTHLIIASLVGLEGPTLWIILFIILLLFGGSKLPALAKGLGKSVKEFKKATEADDDDEDEDEKKPAKKTTSALKSDPTPESQKEE